MSSLIEALSSEEFETARETGRSCHIYLARSSTSHPCLVLATVGDVLLDQMNFRLVQYGQY